MENEILDREDTPDILDTPDRPDTLDTFDIPDVPHLDQILAKITHIYDKYKSDPYMESKTYHYICNQLSTTLENIERNHTERTQRIEDLTIEQYSFIQSFLFHNRYFYHPTTENFFYYDGVNYAQYSEDDVLYNVLSTISRDRNLMSWKHKTKVSIMKQIKDNHIYQTIPESITIQTVLGRLYPSVFTTKTEAKYFLTILGDNILRKENSLIHIISSSAKSLINNLNTLCHVWFGTNFIQSFKFKYHAEHNYSQIRILNSGIGSPNLSDFGLDLLCVACHYSTRYQSSDTYLVKYSNDDSFINSIFYLKNRTPDTLIDLFVSEYIRFTPTSGKIMIGDVIVVNDIIFKPTQITWKNMFYLWKHFLESKHLPNVIFTTKLKTRLIELLSRNYDADADTFNGINSKYLPSVCKFLQFWDETMEADDSEIELEISEIASLFKRWSETRKETVLNMTEKQIVDLISYFYPDTEVDGEKYVYKMRNTLWDKQVDIQMAMDDLKDKLRIVGVPINSVVSAYDAYVHYCNYINRSLEGRPRRPSMSSPISILVSKQYFDKYFCNRE